MKSDETLRQGRILMVDDDVSCLCLLESVLRRLGFPNLRLLQDASLIVPECESYQPDLIITDLDMPKLDGIGLLEQVRAHFPAETFLPVLVLTGYSEPHLKRRALLAGASDLLFKPFDAHEIQVRIRNLLQIRLQQREIQNHNLALEMKVAERTVELEKALKELRSSQEQVVRQERFTAFGEMAGGVVHDFNNSLMSIVGYSDLLLEDETLLRDPNIARDYLRTINTAGCDAAQVVSRLRDFYRPREDADVFAALDINRLVEEVIPLTKPKWYDHALQTGRSINVEMELEKVAPVFGNAAELRQVLTNLLFNAVDALPGDGRITLRTKQENSFVHIDVADTGTGMTEETRRRCMEPFFSTKGENGTGLGLSMSFGIIRRHEGTIHIDSARGCGTTFRISLPACQQAARNEKLTSLKLDCALKVLVADDDDDAREIVTQYLHHDGHRVVAVESGAVALKSILQEHFDLLLTDHGMPGITGLQLAEVVRRVQPGIDIILLTGSETTPAMESIAVDQVLKKPLVRDELRRALHLTVAGERGAADRSVEGEAENICRFVIPA